MSGPRVVAIVIGALFAVLGLGLAVGGGGLLASDAAAGGIDGRLTSPRYSLQTDGAALTAGDVHLGAPHPGDWVGWVDALDLEVRVESMSPSAVFVGIADADDVARYLEGVAHAEVVTLGATGRDATVVDVGGSGALAPPDEQAFWVASVSGTGPLELDWRPEPGTWALLVANADADAGVEVVASAVVSASLLSWLGAGLLGAGVLLLLVAAALLVVGASGQDRRVTQPPSTGGQVVPSPTMDAVASAPAYPLPPPPPPPPSPPPPARSAGPAYPLRLSARLDEPLDRWLWLVKWLLLLPHLVVLVVLWTAFALLTIVAGVAILVTGRYPRAVFEFNVGVLGWTWRVACYGYSALGTDRYPPFSFSAPGYPASIDVDYPARLSRGLVLVKWWLLALPHYLIIGILAGGGLSWTLGGEGRWVLGGGVISLLAVLGGVLVLAGRRYPTGLFDLLIGMNRWVYRVLAYAALMTDVYPPFRLDPGGADPSVPAVPTSPTSPGDGSHTGAPELQQA